MKIKFTKNGQIKNIKANRLTQIETLEKAGWVSEKAPKAPKETKELKTEPKAPKEGK